MDNSYVDDLYGGTTLKQFEEENINPTFNHPPNYKKLSIIDLGHTITISKVNHIQKILSFSGISLKKVNSPSYRVQSYLNRDTRLEMNIVTHKDIRPSNEQLR